jgi:hypothetical protein
MTVESEGKDLDAHDGLVQVVVYGNLEPFASLLDLILRIGILVYVIEGSRKKVFSHQIYIIIFTVQSDELP